MCEEGNKKTCRTPENLNDYRMLPRVWPPGVPPQHIDDRPRPVRDVEATFLNDNS